MAEDDDPTSKTAPDLKILGDQVTLQPSSYLEPPSKDGKDDKEEPLMKNMARFRSEPLQCVLPSH